MNIQTNTTTPVESVPLTCGGYNAGHPWYYLLGGKVPTGKQIRADAVARNYHGYMAERIEVVAKKTEPQRSEILRQIKADVMEELRNDIAGYRRCARKLHAHRETCEITDSTPQCEDVHTNMSLKYAHIYNCFGHLALLESLPEQQGDLFDF